ncbi:MAG TPA: FAD-dependent oxidoreductase, partial [Gemmatimonadales bacterium]|nr:FAD-dependent oxidoreductase [Gemmatimonadales bacterium]
VTLVEQEFAGAGSTGAAMGHLVVMDDSPAQMQLCHLSRQYWDDLARDLPESIEFDRCGTLWVAATDQELESARAKVAVYQRHGIAVEMLDSHALREAEPSLREGLHGALRVPGDAVCYPPVVARILLERALANGMRLVRDRAVRIGTGQVTLQSGATISCGRVVVAAGAHSGLLVSGLPVMPRRGHLCISDRTHIRVRHQLVELGYLHSAHTMGGASVAFNIQPRRTGQLLIGSSR